MDPLWSGALGFVGGLLIAIVSKALDWWRASQVRELDIATLVGELRAGAASTALRLGIIERKIQKLGERIGELSQQVHDLAHHVEDDTDTAIQAGGSRQ